MSALLQRIVTGVLLVAIISFAIVLNVYSYIFLIGLINLLAVAEFYRIQNAYTRFPRWLYGLLLSAVVYSVVILAALYLLSWKFLLIVIPIVFMMFMTELFQHRPNSFAGIALLLFAVSWITIPLTLFTLTAFLIPGSGDYEAAIPLGCFILLWLHDSSAFIGGTLIGRRPLALKVSPNKTWEGSLVAAIITIASGSFISSFIGVLRSTDWMIIACCIVVFGTFGDLFKSILKRSLGIKDSGNILPGHGGMLDRFDSLIGSAPFIYSYLVLMYA